MEALNSASPGCCSLRRPASPVAALAARTHKLAGPGPGCLRLHAAPPLPGTGLGAPSAGLQSPPAALSWHFAGLSSDPTGRAAPAAPHGCPQLEQAKEWHIGDPSWAAAPTADGARLYLQAP